MDLGLPLFKCRDCGRDVDDPTTHVCALAAPKKQAAPAARRPPASSGRGYGSPPSAPRYDDYGGRSNDRGGYGQDDYYSRDHRPTDRYDQQRDDRYQNDRYDDRYGNGNDRRYDDHAGRERYDSHNDQYDRQYKGANDRQYDSSRRYEDRKNSYDSYERSAPSKDPYGAPNGSVPSQEGSDVGVSRAPIAGAAGAAKKGLDFLSTSVGKLFGGSNAPADTKPDAAPPKHAAAPTTDSVIDGMSRHLADTRLDSDDQYRRTPSLLPTAAPAPAPAAASTTPLSEIMLYKDAKSLTCTGACQGRIWKGEEIVLIGDDVLHAKCCTCAECGETAADDEYGSDGWISHEPGRIIVCANCLEKAHEPGDDGAGYHHHDEPPLPAPLAPPAVAPEPPREPDFPTCGTCRVSIMPGDQVVEHAKLPDMHHARCLDCAQCRRPLAATLSPTNPVHVRQGRPLCHPCYLQTLPRCGGCKNVITRDTRVVAALGRKYHPQCFGCVRCGKNFPDKSFYVLNNEPYDKWCYHEANGSLCGGCGHPIEGACACVVEGRFHPRCFCCSACHVALNDVYFAFEGRAFCEVHIAEVQRRRGGGKAERRQTFFKQMS
ncbi:Filamin-binding LIM protein 1 [Allomyces javanicus]|nr:Filamin-binding LIM protein 1 [Allomyces javanicus]